MSETLMLVPYGSTTVGNTQLNRANGAANIVANNSALLGENALRIIWTVNYTAAPNDRIIYRQIVVILAKGGVAKWRVRFDVDLYQIRKRALQLLSSMSKRASS